MKRRNQNRTKANDYETLLQAAQRLHFRLHPITNKAYPLAVTPFTPHHFDTDYYVAANHIGTIGVYESYQSRGGAYYIRELDYEDWPQFLQKVSA